LKGRGFSRFAIGDRKNATLVAEGICPSEYYFRISCGQPANASLFYRGGGRTIYANEEHATYTSAFIEPMKCLPVPRVPESAEWIYEIKLGGYRLEIVPTRNLVEFRVRWEHGKQVASKDRRQ